MDLTEKRIGFAITGSFCTYKQVMPVIEQLVSLGANVVPIVSYVAASLDTRFIKAEDFKDFLRETTGNDILDNLVQVEPIGPKKLLDLVIIAPCTGNTLAKLALGITDTPVVMAAKSQLRNSKPVLIAISTNDALSANAKNLGLLLNTRNIYFVPYRQDDCTGKSTSIVADMTKIIEAAQLALDGKQIQPVMLEPH